MPTCSNIGSMIAALKELYGRPTKPDCVIALEQGRLSQVEQVLYETEIAEYNEALNNDIRHDLIYKDNPFIKMVCKP